MNPIFSEISQVLDASPEQIDSLLNEFRIGQRGIVPKSYFMDLHLLNGKNTAESVVDVKMNLSGTTREFQEPVSETMPSRIILEFDAQYDTVVAIVVEATSDTNKTRVTISTFSANSPYLESYLEQLFASGNIHRIFSGEAQELTEYLQKFHEVPHAS